MKKWLTCIILLTISISLSACSMFSPVKSANYNEYVLNKTPCIAKRYNRHGILYVSPIKADPLYETNAMAYTAKSFRVEYFAKNRWVKPPAKMLLPLVVKTLENSKYFRAVTTTNSTRYDYILNIQLIELRQVFLVNHSYVVFSLRAELINPRTGRIIASKRLTTEVPAQCMNPFSGVVAANSAVEMTLRKLAYFCFRNT